MPDAQPDAPPTVADMMTDRAAAAIADRAAYAAIQALASAPAPFSADPLADTRADVTRAIYGAVAQVASTTRTLAADLDRRESPGRPDEHDLNRPDALAAATIAARATFDSIAAAVAPGLHKMRPGDADPRAHAVPQATREAFSTLDHLLAHRAPDKDAR